MCGIFALLNTNYSIEKINNAFSKGEGRGPESHTLRKIGQSAILGFHRLAINGLNPESDQPLHHNNLTLICNGEIYNYKELYSILNIKSNTDSDCEIILHLYEKFGIERTLQLLDGVFAFILIDYDIESDSAKLYAARDPFGVRPLYVMTQEKQCAKYAYRDLFVVRSSQFVSLQEKQYGFASELKCLTDFEETDYMHSREICQFVPGTYSTYTLSFSVGAQWKLLKDEQRYHMPSVIMNYPNKCNTNLFYNDIANSIAPLITNPLVNAVEKRCSTTERPIACLLSGGLDSSLITAIVSNYHKKNGLPQVETYSIGLEGSVDLYYAKIVADYLGTKHTEIVLTEQDFLSAIPEVIYAIESYDTTSVRASIGNYLLGKYISTHSNAKVIFNGDGSDELTGGYLYFHKAPNEIEFDLECRRLLKDIHYFDVLRSDKCISCHGLEPRTPFLDRSWVQTYLSIFSDIRCHTLHNKCEKYLLRSAFSEYTNISGKPLLPQDILWRKKEAFSDGVSKQSRSLYQIIQQHIENTYTPSNKTYSHNPPSTLEQQYYRDIFETYYPNLGKVVPYMWMPRFVEGATDASARTLQIYDQHMK